jgi:hypothetical protein
MSIDPNQLAALQQQLAQQYQGPQVNPNPQLQQVIEQSILGVINLMNQTTQDPTLNKDIQAKTVLSLAQAIKTLREADIEGSLQFEKARLEMDRQKHEMTLQQQQQSHEQDLQMKQIDLQHKAQESQMNLAMKGREMEMKGIENQQKLSHQHEMNQIKQSQASKPSSSPSS